jgi:hypothetical protein
MKGFLLIIASAFLFVSASLAQSVPQGMKYQAVARDNKGQIISGQKISLKITMLSESSLSYYSEIHEVTTNDLGLFTLVVGAGKADKGLFKDVPWSTQDIWMQVSIKEDANKAFTIISNSKLFAVPYAFHAATAGALVNSSNIGKTSDVSVSGMATMASPANPSLGNSWNAGGNLGTDPSVNYLGTADNVTFVIKTNNIERMRVTADGNVDIKRTLNIGANLNVDSNVNLNRVNGSTINYGPFTVGGNYPLGSALRQSPTLLRGPLTVEANQPAVLGGTLAVDKATQLNNTLTVAGVTNLNNNLNVNLSKSTRLTGTLQVDLPTNLNDSLRVNNMAPTILTGTLNGQKDATFNQRVTLTNAALNADTLSATVTAPNGALVVMGGEWINRNLVVRGDASFGGNTSFAGPVRVTDGTESTSTGTGALTVKGGAGLGKNLNVGGAVKFDSTLNLLGGATLQGTLSVAQPATLNNILNANGQVTVNANVSGGDASFDAYPLRVQGSDQGVAIKVNGTNQASKNYVSFFDGNGKMTGRIEGNTMTEMKDTYEYKSNEAVLSSALAVETAEAVIGLAEIAQGGIKVIAASTSITGCVGLGACVTTPIPSLIVEAGSHLILKIANGVVYAANVAVTAAELAAYVINKENTVGVAYESGSADYAEWLPKENPSETFKAGDIVSIRNGRISKNTDGASQLLVISFKPIVLGNMPKEGREKDYEKVAFMGQVPVYVWGNVEKGDYIVCDGLGDGFGIAVNPARMKMDQYKKIVGIAWSSSTGKGVSMVNVAIGLNRNDMADVLQAQEAEIKELKVQAENTNNILARLVPGFKEAAGIKGDAPIASTQSLPSLPTAARQIAQEVVPATVGIAYHEVSTDQTEEMFAMAEKVFVESGGKYKDHPFWNRIKSEAGYKASIMNTVKEKLKEAVHYHEESNGRLFKH